MPRASELPLSDPVAIALIGGVVTIVGGIVVQYYATRQLLIKVDAAAADARTAAATTEKTHAAVVAAVGPRPDLSDLRHTIDTLAAVGITVKER
jgi:hypothetical protein